MAPDQQSFLLSDSAMQAARYSTYANFKAQAKLGPQELKAWKQRIIRFQVQVQTSPAIAQGSLFASPPPVIPKTTPTDVAAIDPFGLPRQNTEFWRWQFDDVGVAAMYFVMDYAGINHHTNNNTKSNITENNTPENNTSENNVPEKTGQPLLLYIGETVKSNQRWKGVHDCKRYLTNYRQAHFDNGLTSELGIAFWPHAPVERQPRQQLESGLIYRWRSPFNKENWRFWNTPFVNGK